MQKERREWPKSRLPTPRSHATLNASLLKQPRVRLWKQESTDALPIRGHRMTYTLEGIADFDRGGRDHTNSVTRIDNHVAMATDDENE